MVRDADSYGFRFNEFSGNVMARKLNVLFFLHPDGNLIELVQVPAKT